MLPFVESHIIRHEIHICMSHELNLYMRHELNIPTRIEDATRAAIFPEAFVMTGSPPCSTSANVLQCVAVCCGVLQCVAMCCSVLRCVAVYCGV